VLEPLVPDPGEALRLLAEDRRLEPRVGELAERGLDAEEAKEREDQPAAGPEVGGRLRDHPVEQAPAVPAAVVGSRHRVAPLAVGGRRHLGRARADQIEHEPAHRLEAVAEPDVDPVRHPVERRVLPRAPHRGLHHVGGDHPRARPRRAHRGQADAGADLEDALFGLRVQVTAEQERARLRRLRPVGHLEGGALEDEEEHPVIVGHLPITRRK
jgi:hypothetical protein